MPVVPPKDIVVEHEVLRACLGHHRHPPRLCLLHDFGALGGGHVDDVELAAGDLRPHHRPLDRLRFDEVRPRHRVQSGAVLLHQLGRVMPGDQLVEHPRRFRVHEEHGAVLLHLLQRTEHRAIVRLPPLGLVDHEFLEGGEAAVHHPLDLVLVLVPPRDTDVKGVVDQRFPLSALHPVVGGVVERFTGIRNREVDQRRDAAARARAGAAAIVVGGRGAAERQLKMHVHVEYTGNDVVARSVDDLRVARRGESRADRGDLLAGDPDVGDYGARRGDDVPAADDSVECHWISGCYPTACSA